MQRKGVLRNIIYKLNVSKIAPFELHVSSILMFSFLRILMCFYGFSKLEGQLFFDGQLFLNVDYID